MKKLIVLATLAALPAVALADVTISGDLAVGIVNTKAGGTSKAGSITTENRTSGELKFAGSDDIGNGLKAIWQIGTRINLADTTGQDARDNQLSGRESFVGLTGGFGTLRMGTLLFMPTAGKMSVFENNSATWRSQIYDTDNRYNNTLEYKSPSLSGFTATVQHSFGDSHAAEGATSAGREADKLYSQAVSLAYEGNGFTLSYDGARHKEDTLGQTKSSRFVTVHELNGSVQLGDLNLMAGYAQGKDELAKGKRKGYGVAATYTYGNFVPKFEYWHEGDAKVDGQNQRDGSNNYAVGVEYGLSKRTRAGVEYVRTNYKSSALENANATTVYLGTKF